MVNRRLTGDGAEDDDEFITLEVETFNTRPFSSDASEEAKAAASEFTLVVSALDAGDYTALLLAVDGFGNQSYASADFTVVDKTPPRVSDLSARGQDIVISFTEEVSLTGDKASLFEVVVMGEDDEGEPTMKVVSPSDVKFTDSDGVEDGSKDGENTVNAAAGKLTSVRLILSEEDALSGGDVVRVEYTGDATNKLSDGADNDFAQVAYVSTEGLPSLSGSLLVDGGYSGGEEGFVVVSGRLSGEGRVNVYAVKQSVLLGEGARGAVSVRESSGDFRRTVQSDSEGHFVVVIDELDAGEDYNVFYEITGDDPDLTDDKHTYGDGEISLSGSGFGSSYTGSVDSNIRHLAAVGSSDEVGIVFNQDLEIVGSVSDLFEVSFTDEDGESGTLEVSSVRVGALNTLILTLDGALGSDSTDISVVYTGGVGGSDLISGRSGGLRDAGSSSGNFARQWVSDFEQSVVFVPSGDFLGDLGIESGVLSATSAVSVSAESGVLDIETSSPIYDTAISSGRDIVFTVGFSDVVGTDSAPGDGEFDVSSFGALTSDVFRLVDADGVAVGSGFSGLMVVAVDEDGTALTQPGASSHYTVSFNAKRVQGDYYLEALSGIYAGDGLVFSPVILEGGVSLFSSDRVSPEFWSVELSDEPVDAGGVVRFTLHFSEEILGVPTADNEGFSKEDFVAKLGTSTLTNAVSVHAVTRSGSASELYSSSFVVEVASGTSSDVANAMVSLEWEDGATFRDYAGNTFTPSAGAITGATKALNVAPYAVSASASADIVYDNDAITFTVTFNEDVTDVAAADFSVNVGTISSVNGTSAGDSTWEVVVTTDADDGEAGDFLRLSLVDGAKFKDTASTPNERTVSGTHELSSVIFSDGDQHKPVISRAAASTSPTHPGEAAVFTIYFSEEIKISSVSSADFAASTGGTGSIRVSAVGGSIGGTSDTFIVSVMSAADVDSSTPAADVVLEVDGASFEDVHGNILSFGQGVASLASLSLRDTPYIIGVSHSLESDVIANALLSSGSINFGVTFSEAVSGVDRADFAVSGGRIVGSPVDVSSGQAWRISVLPDGTGDVVLSTSATASFDDTGGLAGTEDQNRELGRVSVVTDDTPPQIVSAHAGYCDSGQCQF